MSETDSNAIKVEVDLTKPATVLIEKISGAVGVLYEPTRIKKKAKADAESEILMAKAKVKATQIEKRAAKRLILEETRKQNNMEAVVEKALPQLDKTADPSDVEDDWLAHFFEQSRLTSDKEMQELWARILAGEANRPGSYSKRTINLVSMLEKGDAELFGKLSNYVWVVNGRPAPLIFDPQNEIYTNQGLNFDAMKHLESLGLVSFDSLAGYQITFPGMAGRFLLHYLGHTYAVQVPEGRPNDLPIGTAMLTNQGLELLSISSATKVPGLEEYVKERVESNNNHKFTRI
jgi:hypothetical protein